MTSTTIERPTPAAGDPNNALEVSARRCAADLRVPAHRDYIAAQLARVQAFLGGLNGGLHLADSTGDLAVDPAILSDLGLFMSAFGAVAPRIASGDIWVKPAGERPVEWSDAADVDLTDSTGPIYLLHQAEIDAREQLAYRRGRADALDSQT
jgi:hypothetical protein